MTSDQSESRERRAEAIFAAMLDLPTADRPAALDNACAGDGDLRRRVDELASALERAGGFMSDATADSAERAPAPDFVGGVMGDVTLSAAIGEKLGDMIGPYKLLEKIGEGGFGVVFKAEQREPVRRQVAIKVIKLGMDTKEVVARFEAERQALAMMDHPNIARVLDAGATATGRPYFVMELVRGSPVTDYADRHMLDTRQRVQLATQICRAVQHAHGRGVIHRDIKPSNVLVTVSDDRPIPKVIDFGIAKATQSRLTERTLFTAHQQLIGTPQYMSPEQADSDGTDVDTRTDIYSLGVLIYELLVGTTPLDARSLRSAAFEAMRKMIRETEPSKPSTKLHTLAGEAQASVATNRKTDARQLSRQLHGELDWIVMKSLEKDRSRRYDTAAALADDMARYLAGEAVLAGPVSGLYRFRKIARRHRGLLAMTGIVAAALLLGVIGTTIGLVRESRQRKLADTQRTIAQTERDGARAAVSYLTQDVLDAAFRQEPHDQAARKVLAAVITSPSVLDVDAHFPGHPIEAATVREALVWSLDAVGQNKLAIDQADQTLKTRRAWLGDDHPDTIRAAVMTAYFRRFDPVFGLPVAKDAFDRSRRVCGDRDPLTLWAEYTYACVLNGLNRSAEALPLIEQAYEGQEAVLGADHLDTLRSLEAFGVISEWAGHPNEAVPLTKIAFARSQSTRGPQDAMTILSLAAVANALRAADREAEAVDQYADASSRMTRWLGPTDPNTQMYLGRYAQSLSHLNRWPEAQRLYKQLWDTRKQISGVDHPGTLLALSGYATATSALGNRTQAEPLLQQAVDAFHRVHPDDPGLGIALFNLGKCLVEQKKWNSAEPILRECLTFVAEHPDAEQPVVESQLRLLLNQSLSGQGTAAEPIPTSNLSATHLPATQPAR